MRMIQTSDYQELSHTAAVLILNELIEKPDFVL
ncbi:MAG: glucosamine-6-phosphate deaminase, partial [Candidatus Melainabacteria bacterium HGW-Melainabacteria-1]